MVNRKIENNANVILERIHEWGQKVKLNFNPLKSSAVLITKKIKSFEIKLSMNVIEIKIEDITKYLGVIIDNKLGWNQHINYIFNKTRETIIKLPIIARNTWDLSYESLKLIYIAAIEPMITYCVSVWGQNLTQRQIKKLKTLQRLFNIKMIRAYRTISHESATAMLGLTPININ